MNKKYLAWGLMSSLVVFGSCVKEDAFEDISLPNYQGEWVFPLVNSKATFAEMLEPFQEDIPVEISTDERDVYIISYLDTIETGVASDYYQLQEESFSETIGAPEDLNWIHGVPLQAGISASESFEFDYDMKQPLDFQGQDIDADLRRVGMNDGELDFSISSDLRHDVELRLKFTSLQKGGQPFVKTVNLDYAGTTPVVANVKENLEGYVMELEQGGNLNTIRVEVTASVVTQNEPIYSTDEISLSLALNRIEFSYIEGRVGVFDLPIASGDIGINFFENSEDFSVALRDPKVTMNVVNSLGVPVSIIPEDLVFTNADGKTATASPTGGDIALNHPTVLYDSAETEIVLDGQNMKDLEDAFNIGPNNVAYDVSLKVGDNAGTDFFVTEESKIKVAVKAQIPAGGRVQSYVVKDTINDLGLADFEDSLVAYAELKFRANNALPLNAQIQGYFVDEQGNLVDSLFTEAKGESLLLAGEVDAEGLVTAPTFKETIIQVDRERFSVIKNAERIVFVAKFSTANADSQDVFIRSTDWLQVNLGAKVKFDANLNEL